MKLHTCLFCIGSNTDKEQTVLLARKRLEEYFPDVQFGDEMLTEPLYFSGQDLFLNQLGMLKTELPPEDVKRIFHQIETEAGKQADDKQQEIVRLDIDLLMYDRHVLKPKDMEREYIKEGLKALPHQIARCLHTVMR